MRVIATNWRIVKRIRTFTTSDFPAITVIAVGAMAGKTPHIAEGPDDGHPGGQVPDHFGSEISAVDVAKIDDIRPDTVDDSDEPPA